MKLQIVPHRWAPLFQRGDRGLILKQLISDMVSGNYPTTEEYRQFLRQAAYVNLYFCAKFIFGYSGPFDKLNGTLHVEMANFRQSLLYPGCRGAMFLPRGHGKCLHAEETVWIEGKGPRLAKELQPGDVLWGFSSRSREAERVKVRANLSGEAPGYEVRLASGRSVRVAEDHKFLTFGGWKEARLFKEGERIAVLSTISGGTPGREEDYFIGLLYGDGSTRTGMLTLTNADEEILEAAQRFWPHNRFLEASTTGKASTLSFYGGLSWWRERGLTEELAHGKDFPPSMEGSSAFLQGLFDTDGTVSKNGALISYCSSSKRLALGVLHELSRFGIFASLYRKENSFQGAWIVQITGRGNIVRFQQQIGFRVSRKKTRLQETRSPSTKYGTLPLSWKEVLHYGDAYYLRQKGVRVDNSYSPTKEKVLRVAKLLQRTDLKELALQPLVWDYVVSVKKLGRIPIARIMVTGPQNYACIQGVLHHNTKLVTETGSAWELLRDPELSIRISNAKEENAAGFHRTVKEIFESNPLVEWLFGRSDDPSGSYIPTKNQPRWNNSELVLPNRRRFRREGNLEYGGVFGASEGHHYDLHIVDDMIGLAALTSARASNAVMESTRNWFWGSEKTLLSFMTTSRMIVVGTRYAIDDVYGDILQRAKKTFGYPLPYFKPNPRGSWVIYYRKALEDGEIIFPESITREGLEELAEDDWWTYVTQYMNDPQQAGLAEFTSYPLRTCQVEFDERALEWFIILKGGEEDEEKIPLSSCDVVLAADPAATETGITAKTSRTAVGVVATDPEGRRFLIWLRVDYVAPNQLFNWLFEAYDKFGLWIRACFLEQNGPFKILGPFLRDEQLRRGKWLGVRPFRAVGDKDARIRSVLDPEFAEGRIYVNEVHKLQYEEEHRAFPQSRKKDILDMFSSAISNSYKPPSEDEKMEAERAEARFRNRAANQAGG